MSPSRPLLLSVVELGGYPNFRPLYEALGYEVRVAASMRKVIAQLKKQRPGAIVAEFNFQSDFRDRTSNLESLLATTETRCPDARIIVFYEPGQQGHLERLLGRYSVTATLSFPIDEARLRRALALDDVAADV